MLYTALFIHDSHDAPDRVRGALAEIGCEVACARTAAEAQLRLAQRRAPELVVLDVADPVTACHRLAGRLRGAPVLAIVDRGLLAAALDAGADDCVARDAGHGELVARARAVLRAGTERMRRMKRERRQAEELRKLQRDKHALEKIACVDSLTGVANRRHTLALLEAEWKRSARAGSPLSLVMIDLDSFHEFNERYGHVGGDECLRRVSAAMVGSLRRPSDFLGRYGGEEFLAVLATTDASGAAIVAERLRAAVEALAIEHIGSSCRRVVTISVGFATTRARADLVAADLVSKADHSLLTAKALGKNRVVGEAPPAAPRPAVSPLPWTRFPTVVADPWFADRIPGFLAGRRDDAFAIAAGCETGAFERIRVLARRMRSAASDHGFERIKRLAGVVEQGARDEDTATIRAAIEEIVQYVDHVQVTYRRPLEPTG